MGACEVCVSDLVGRRVLDADGRSIGRLEEMVAQVELHERGKDYVVAEFHVGAYGALEVLAGATFARHLLRKLRPLVRYRLHRVPWKQMDLSDPSRPRTRCRAAELPGV